MASPPPFSASSPASSTPLALPRQRPTLALPGQASSRKPSAGSATSTHPLRQTSFPGADSLEAQHAAAEDAVLRFSPSIASQGSLEDEFSDTEIASAIAEDGGGSATKKRKRGAGGGEKRPRGRPSKAQSQSQHGRAGSSSVVNAEHGGSRGDTAGAASGGEDEEDDDDLAGGAGGGRAPLYAGGEMSAQEFLADNEAKAAFRNYMEILDRQRLTSTNPSRAGLTVADMAERYDVQYRAKLHRSDVRRLVNQTLSQSVPGNVVLVVSAYTKMFAMDLIGEARKVQEEWMGAETKRADGEPNPAYERLKAQNVRAAAEENEERENEPLPKSSPSGDASSATVKQESSPTQPDTHTQSQSQPRPESVFPGGAGGLHTSFEECDRGPLLPDHLREALRRYKKGCAGGSVGFTGHSLEGREVAAPRMGGRRLFR